MEHERETTPSDEPPQKRQRVLACRRCRGRKQKCEDRRPCTNCIKSGDECLPMEPAPRPQAHVESQYVRALEERIAELESHDPRHSLDHMPPAANGQPPVPATSTVRPLAHGGSASNGSPSLGVIDENVAVRRMSEAINGPNYAGDGNSVSPANQSAARRSYSRQSPGGELPLCGESDSGLDHLIFGLVTSPSIRDDGQQSLSAKSPGFATNSVHEGEYFPQSLIAAMPLEVEERLLNAYRGRAQAQYPMFRWDVFLTWLQDWKTCPPAELPSRYWQGFFVNLVYSTALLLLSLPRVGQSDAMTFYKNGISLLPHVLRHSNPIHHVQAYILLGINALHRNSTSRILSVASSTMRYCIQLQLHLAETEPDPIDLSTRLENQVRRRCFWSAYCLDRLVMSSLELPPSVSDNMISAKVYANIDDEDLEAVAARTPADTELPDSPVYTCVSSSLHILQCRRIQSEIFGYTLRCDYKLRFEDSLDWRVRILTELENYKERVQNFSDPQAKGHTSQRWLAMIYHYTLLTLYRPTKDSVLGPAGDWSIQASSQACLMFRKSQMDRQIAQAWLGLLVQFQSGVTILYCCWATPPEYRTENYDSPDVSDAIRACSNILAILTDRWPKAECLRDVFELLAREVPLVDRPSRPPTRISEASAAAIKEKLPQIRALIVHRSIMRMVEEMVTDDFPRIRGEQTPHYLLSRRSTPALPPRDRPLPAMANPQMPSASPATVSFELPFTTQQMYGVDGTTGDDSSLKPDEMLAFPGMFDLDSWA